MPVRALTPGLLGALMLLLVACSGAGGSEDDETSGDEETAAGDETEQTEQQPTVTVYSGRSEELVGPILDRYAEQADVEVEVRYGDTAEMAATILEEGQNSPADLFFGQDAGALGALAAEERLVELPEDITGAVDERFVDPAGQWVGTSGRARVVAYNTDAVDPDELPESLLDVTDPQWDGRVGWAPTNGSFQAHVTAMRVELGDEAVVEWLEDLEEAGVAFENNTAIIEGLGRGEVDIGLVNHYYLYRFLEEDPEFPVENAFLTSGDIGNLVNIAGVGVTDTAQAPEETFDLVRFLLEEEAQQYFADEVFEFPVVDGVEGDPRLPSIEEIDTPEIDLSDLRDLEGTLELMREAGALP